MERRFLLFIVLSFTLVWFYVRLTTPQKPPEKPPVAQRADDDAPDEEDQDADPKGVEAAPDDPEKPGKPSDETDPDAPADDPTEDDPAEIAEDEPPIPTQWITLGSADRQSDYRMLVTLTNKGAAVARTELNSPNYLDLEDRSGFIGSLTVDEREVDDELRGKGFGVQVVGPGTPADRAGLKPGDLIVAVNKEEVTNYRDFRKAMQQTRPNRDVELTVVRDGDKETLTATTQRKPLQLTRPEKTDPLSFLFTLNQVDSEKLSEQRLRDIAMVRLFDEMAIREPILQKLKLADLNMPSGEIRVPNSGKGVWVPLSEASLEALNVYMAFRKDAEGPLFPASVAKPTEPIPLERIEEIVAQLQQRAPLQRDDEIQRDNSLFVELDGIDLRNGNWEVVTASSDEAVFRRKLPKLGLEVTKKYRLAKVPAEVHDDRTYPAYHLTFQVGVRNIGKKDRKVAYQLDGPTGLPDEGAWFANKASRTWSMAGLRDIVVSFDEQVPKLVTCTHIANDDVKGLPWEDGTDGSISYIGVDAQYFSAVFLPEKDGNPGAKWFAESWPIRVGSFQKKLAKMANTSCRLVSHTKTLEPNEEMGHEFTVFMGPKQRDLIAEYGLSELVYFGWFGAIAKLLIWILHIFHDYMVFNYGLAILLLTVVVRGAMFPLSRKQALGAIKMQELQPEIKKIQEKYKKDMEARSRAQQELFRKHNYNPLSGCLVIFVQLPIFIALYRTLMVDIELRQAPLISQSVRWCSNLAAPDMLFNWSGFMPDWVNSGVGFFGLGPYFNILPILTIVLFIAQQKMFMPPPTDPQQEMQQKMMKFMMIFMGFIFFKVASGLCIYFIASSLWGLAERQLLPKAKKPDQVDKADTRADAKARARAEAKAAAEAKQKHGGNGAPQQKKKRGGRK